MQFRYVPGLFKYGLPNGILHAVAGIKVGMPKPSRRHVLFAANRNGSSKGTTIFQRKVKVKAFGKLFVESHWLPVQVRHTESSENYVGICVNAESVEKLPPGKLRGHDCGLTFRAELNQNTQNVYIRNEAKFKESLNFLRPWLLVEIPLQFDVSVQSFSNNDVTLSNLESTNIDCCLQYGQLVAENIKCEHFNIMSTAGNVQCQGPVLGNVNIKTAGQGCIRADRLQGSVVRLRSDEGEIKVNAIYAESSNVASGKASVSLANLHGRSRVSLYQGDLTIVGLDGGLTATIIQGNADIKISRLLPNAHAAVIANDGNIVLRLADDLVARLRLEGKDVKVEDKVQGTEITETDSNGIIFEGYINTAEFIKDPLITAIAPMGEVTIGIQNWLPRLNLV